MSVVNGITTLMQSEAVRLDPDRLGALYRQLGEANAEDVVCRAVEELAVRMTHCERLWRQEEWSQLRKSARSLIAIAEQVGMPLLSRVAKDVTQSIDGGDRVATAATLARLMRVGERSVTAVWDLQDLSI
ncbi:hypothetical protein CFI11_01565 [Thalassococcus sp. S3]|nr:hypothetical protein [Thalassococcus sp. S3]QBF29907.1 hypothetical protein CFI11_01565 [Thalassococcus sp. S3]